MKTFTKAYWLRQDMSHYLYMLEFQTGTPEFWFEDGECSCMRRFSDKARKVVLWIGAHDECSNCKGHGIMPIPPQDVMEVE